MLPIPNIDGAKFRKSLNGRKAEVIAAFTASAPKLYRCSRRVVWAYGEELEVFQGLKDYKAEALVVGESRSQFSPDYVPEEVYEIATQLMQSRGVAPKQAGDETYSRAQSSRQKSREKEA